jgi:hypothetical protein
MSSTSPGVRHEGQDDSFPHDLAGQKVALGYAKCADIKRCVSRRQPSLPLA